MESPNLTRTENLNLGRGGDETLQNIQRRIQGLRPTPTSALSPTPLGTETQPGMPGTPVENVAANDPNPNVRALGEQMARIENMLRGMGGVPGVAGAPGGLNTHPGWLIHPGWTQGPGGAYGAPYSGSLGAPPAQLAPPERKSIVDSDAAKPTEEMVREALKKLKEEQPATATAPEHQKAAMGFRARRKAEWDQFSKFVSDKHGTDSNLTRVMAKAPRAWGWKATSGILALTAGYTTKMLASKLGLTSALGAALPAWATAPLTLPLIGATIPFSLPAILAVAGGIGLWQLVKWGTGMRELDKAADRGWETRKVRKEMRKATRKGYNPDIEKIYERVHGRKHFLRMQNIVPGLLGAAIGGGAMYEWHTGNKNLNWENVGKLKEAGKGWLGGFWERVTAFFTGGEPISPRTTPADHAAGCDGIKKELELTKLNAERLRIEGIRVPPASDIYPPGGATAAADLPPAMPTPSSAPSTIASAPDPKFPIAGVTDPSPGTPPLSGDPVVTAKPAPAAGPVTMVPDTFGGLPRSTNFNFVVHEGTDVRSLPHGLRGAFSSAGFEGNTAEWLIDTVDKKTYRGSGNGSRLLEAISTRTPNPNNALLTPTKIPDTTPFDLKKYFRSPMAIMELEADVHNSRGLTPVQKEEVLGWIKKFVRFSGGR